MSEKTDGGTLSSGRRAGGGELVIPVVALAFTVYYFSTIISSPWTAQVSAFFVGTILIALIGIFLVRAALAYRSGDMSLSLGPLLEPVSILPKRMGLFAITIGFIILIQFLGFTITTFLAMAGSMLLLNEGRRLGFIILLSAGVSIAGWALFVLAFETRFPVGPFEAAMARWFG